MKFKRGVDNPPIFLSILGAFAKLREVTSYQLRHVCLSVSLEQFGSHWTDFCETWHLSIFRKSYQKIQDLITPDRNNRHFT
jgi:hypothetical protein